MPDQVQFSHPFEIAGRGSNTSRGVENSAEIHAEILQVPVNSEHRIKGSVVIEIRIRFSRDNSYAFGSRPPANRSATPLGAFHSCGSTPPNYSRDSVRPIISQRKNSTVQSAR
eukprot:1327091-Amorphochlora_amoeboformis.AAC.1